MFGIGSLSGSVQAVATVGFVLAEAVVLNVVYGTLSNTVGSTVIDAIGGD